MTRLVFILVGILLVACSPLSPPELTGTASRDTPIPLVTETAIPPAMETPTPTVRPDPTPTREVDNFPVLPDKSLVVPGEGFKVLNSNPRLDFVDPVRTERIEPGQVVQWAEQCRPRGYTIYNLYQDIDGNTDNHTRLTEVFADGIGCRADVSVYAGETGLRQIVEVESEGCHIIKIGGAYAIIDPEFRSGDHVYNYGVRPYLESGAGGRRLELGRYTFPDLVGIYDRHWPVWIGATGTYELTAAVSVSYPTADPASDVRPLGSWIRLEVIAIADDLDGDHCDSNSPRI